MGLKIITDGKPVTVYRQDKTSQAGNPYTTYSVGVASKNTDGSWVNGFQTCLFKKGVELNHKAKIEITNSFFTVNEYNGVKQLRLFILDFTVVDAGEQKPVVNANDDFMNINMEVDEEVPFQ